MTTETPKQPQVFVSYSWSSQEHQDRILEWAEKLVADGVHVILDKWDLREGQDKYKFMEQMVTAPEVTKVLVFSDQRYAQKADGREGGVGTESQIISSEIYEKVAQEKFLPIVCERDANSEPYLPTFFKTRIYFDFSNPELFHENYEKLVRAIFNKPLYRRPPLGSPPAYILSNNKPSRWSRPLLEDYKEAVMKDRATQRGHATRFLETLATRLEEFRISPKDEGEFDDQVVSSIDAFLPFRDDFVDFVDTLTLYQNSQESIDQLAGFFEQCLTYKFRPEEQTPWNNAWSDNFNFIIAELFLYTAALLIKKRTITALGQLTNRRYLLPKTAYSIPDRGIEFQIFCCFCGSLDYRNQRLKLRRLDLVADLLKQRATLTVVPFNQLIQTDALLFLINLLNENVRRIWYPHTLIYASYERTLDIFARAAIKSEFKRLATVLSVASKDELLAKFDTGIKAHGANQWTNLVVHSDIRFRDLFGFDQLDTIG